MFDNSFYEVLGILEKISVIMGVAFVAIQIWLQTKIARADNDRKKKQSTIEFYDLLFTKIYQFLNDIKDKDLNLSTVNTDKALKKSVTKYFARLERLAVGVYYEVYDLKILCYMAGRRFSDIYNQFKIYIYEVRIKEYSPNRYKEFERLVKDIDKDREKCPGEIIGKRDRVKQL